MKDAERKNHCLVIIMNFGSNDIRYSLYISLILYCNFYTEMLINNRKKERKKSFAPKVFVLCRIANEFEAIIFSSQTQALNETKFIESVIYCELLAQFE